MTMAGQSGDSDPGAASLDDVADLRDSSGWRRLLRTQELWITVAVLVIGLVVSQL
jgi:hypothetical protein